MRNRPRFIFNHVNMGARIPRYLSIAVLSSMQKPEMSSLARDDNCTSGSRSGRILASVCMQSDQSRGQPCKGSRTPSNDKRALFSWDLCKLALALVTLSSSKCPKMRYKISAMRKPTVYVVSSRVCDPAGLLLEHSFSGCARSRSSAFEPRVRGAGHPVCLAYVFKSIPVWTCLRFKPLVVV